jgi:hypothetical protein
MPRRPIIGQWSSNVGFLLAHKVADGGNVWVSCTRCKVWEPIDLPALVIKRNPLFSLWNRRPRCPGCREPLSLHAHHAPGARVIPLLTDDPRQTDDLHRAWERERRRMIGIKE